VGCDPVRSSPRCTKCNSPMHPCTNFILFDVALVALSHIAYFFFSHRIPLLHRCVLEIERSKGQGQRCGSAEIVFDRNFAENHPIYCRLLTAGGILFSDTTHGSDEMYAMLFSSPVSPTYSSYSTYIDRGEILTECYST